MLAMFQVKRMTNKDKSPQTAVTIFIVTNDDNVILNAFTSMEDAKRYIDIKYSILPEKFNIEPCALNVDAEFLKEIEKKKLQEVQMYIMCIKNRKKIEKALAGLLNEMIAQGMIDENKKETIEQLEAAREYELRQICEEIAEQYLLIKKPI